MSRRKKRHAMRTPTDREWDIVEKTFFNESDANFLKIAGSLDDEFLDGGDLEQHGVYEIVEWQLEQLGKNDVVIFFDHPAKTALMVGAEALVAMGGRLEESEKDGE